MEALRRAHEILPKDADPRLRARVLEMLARRTMLSGDVQQGIEFSQQAVEAAALAFRLGHGERVDHIRRSLAAAGQEEEGSPRSERVSHLARSNTRTLLRFYQLLRCAQPCRPLRRSTPGLEQAIDVAGELIWNAPSVPCSPGMPPNPFWRWEWT